MIINTKYDVNQKIFVLLENKILDGVIHEIIIKVKEKDANAYDEIFYDIDCYGDVHREIIEKDLYKTKKEAEQELTEQLWYEVEWNYWELPEDNIKGKQQ